MRDHEASIELGSQLPAVPLAIAFFASTLTWRLPEPYDWISMMSFVFLLRSSTTSTA